MATPAHNGEVLLDRRQRSTKRITKGGMAWNSRNRCPLAVAAVKGENP